MFDVSHQTAREEGKVVYFRDGPARLPLLSVLPITSTAVRLATLYPLIASVLQPFSFHSKTSFFFISSVFLGVLVFR